MSGIPFTGRCFRIVELESFLKVKTPELLFDLGPKVSKYGQRFSPPGNHCGLYVSTELMTADSEFADGKTAWLAGDCAKHVTFDMEVKLQSVLDLTDVSVRRALKVTKAEVQSAWLGFAELNNGAWPPTWSLGHAAYSSGRFDGILYPSTKSANGICLLIFTESLIAGETHVVIHHQDGSVWERMP